MHVEMHNDNMSIFRVGLRLCHEAASYRGPGVESGLQTFVDFNIHRNT